MEDSKIVSLYWERSERAIAESSRKYGSYCGYIARNILRSREESDECVNDTWLNAWNSIPPHKPELLSAFLGKITRNLAITRAQRAAAQKRGGGEFALALEELSECVAADDRTESRYEENALSELLNRFLEAQSAENRRLFVRRYWYLAPVKTLARDSGLSESAAKMRLARMREELKELLIKEGYEL